MSQHKCTITKINQIVTASVVDYLRIFKKSFRFFLCTVQYGSVLLVSIPESTALPRSENFAYLPATELNNS